MPGSWPIAIQMVTRFYSADSKPDEKQINAILHMAARNQKLDATGPAFEKAFRELRSKLSAKIAEGVTLTDTDSTWTEWLPSMKKSDRWNTPRWDAYYQYLQKTQGADWTQLQPLDKSTDTILGQLSDPRQGHISASRKGLILGDVQSGKTRTYLALMNKAVDCGYKLIIVLTSSDEHLRQQTQQRIDSDFVGYAGKRKRIGLGKVLSPELDRKPFSLTNENDFVKAQSNALEPLPRPSWNDSRPVVAVMKKNGSVLDKFNQWLDNPEFSKDLPVLIIDDESDYASVNSAKAEDSPTRINSLLRKLCSISARTSYVAVTATPFANVFIDDETEEDLFPKDFIHILPTPYAYVGAKKLFGDLETLPRQGNCVRELDEEKLDEWLPLSHKKTYRFASQELDRQVQYAISCFFVACALRPDAENKRQSMLIHMSRFTAVQQQIADMVHVYVGDLITALKFHANTNDPRILALFQAYTNEYESHNQTHGLSWPTLLHKIQQLTDRLQVRLVNSDSAGWNDSHQVPEDIAQNECTIFIGGNQISRGMTLDGLICSIFYRRVTASDTLLQMGRWFGYRPKYEQLQRIWLLEQSKIDYRYSFSIVEELKERSKLMQHQGMTPKQFGLAIMKNPNKGVRITSASKMRNASEGNGGVLAEFDLTGQIIESIRLGTSTDQITANNAALNALINTCDSLPQVVSSKSSNQIYQHVPGDVIADFLSQYRAGYNDKYFGPTLMQYKDHVKEMSTTMAAEYAKTQSRENPDVTWNLAFISGRGDQVSGADFSWKEIERTSSFDKDHSLFAINGRKMRLAGKSDILKVAKVVSKVPTPTAVDGSERNLYLTKYFGDCPTLMLYRVHVKPDKEKYNRLAPALGHGLLAVKIIIPTDDITDQKGRGKVYYYNTVATRHQYESLQDQAEGDDED
jgi:hypothetical protein